MVSSFSNMYYGYYKISYPISKVNPALIWPRWSKISISWNSFSHTCNYICTWSHLCLFSRGERKRWSFFISRLSPPTLHWIPKTGNSITSLFLVSSTSPTSSVYKQVFPSLRAQTSFWKWTFSHKLSPFSPLKLNPGWAGIHPQHPSEAVLTIGPLSDLLRGAFQSWVFDLSTVCTIVDDYVFLKILPLPGFNDNSLLGFLFFWKSFESIPFSSFLQPSSLAWVTPTDFSWSPWLRCNSLQSSLHKEKFRILSKILILSYLLPSWNTSVASQCLQGKLKSLSTAFKALSYLAPANLLRLLSFYWPLLLPAPDTLECLQVPLWVLLSLTFIT